MMTFVYREQLHARTGTQEGQGTAVSDLWNMPLNEKLQTGNIYLGLRITSRQRSSATSGYDLITFKVVESEKRREETEEASLLSPQAHSTNFRPGDSIFLYSYQGEPDITASILYKGTLEQITADSLTVKLNNGQQNADTFDLSADYAIEHGASDVSTSNNLRSLYSFACAPADRRALLLGQRPPRLLERREESQIPEYYLLQGPPGTGKTSRALRTFVGDELAAGGTVLLTAYTNRAVDEICQMLKAAGHDYLRIANPSSCAPDCRDHLVDSLLGDKPRLDDIRRSIDRQRIVVATISMLQSRPFILHIKTFTLTIVDEASQILEPLLMGLLSSPSTGRFILVGDHKQLPAVVQQNAEESRVSDPQLNAIGLTDCRHSLFERLLRWERSQGRTQFIGTLHQQGRMHPEVADFACRMFYRQEQLTAVPLPHQTATTIGYTQPPLDDTDRQLLSRRTLFFDCSGPEAEAALVADLARRVCRLSGNDFTPRTLGIIVLYRNQIDLIRQQLEKEDACSLLDAGNLSIDTVERYQGSQRDVIIYSPSVSRESQLQFLTASTFEEAGQPIDRKLNVAITRARKQLIVVGNSRLLRLNALYAKLIDSFTTHN
jgi:superfamily I DNA and/or RNA helicase